MCEGKQDAGKAPSYKKEIRRLAVCARTASYVVSLRALYYYLQCPKVDISGIVPHNINQLCGNSQIFHLLQAFISCKHLNSVLLIHHESGHFPSTDMGTQASPGPVLLSPALDSRSMARMRRCSICLRAGRRMLRRELWALLVLSYGLRRIIRFL